MTGVARSLRLAVRVLSTGVIAGAVALVVLQTLAPVAASVVLSGSMEPAIPVGSLTISRRVPAEQLKLGDIITYRPAAPAPAGQLGVSQAVDGRAEASRDPTVTHRIVEFLERGPNPVLRTKGDANSAPDAQLVRLSGGGWRHAFTVPYLGFAVVFAQSSTGRLLLVVVPGLLLAGMWLRDALRRMNRARERHANERGPERAIDERSGSTRDVSPEEREMWRTVPRAAQRLNAPRRDR
ncbi:MAG: signal peptidase I [Chloroflexi bacterium]|nr:signal peptidase I [Chloroflexota bacterium]